MATQNFINECKNMANANRLGRFELQMYDRFEKEFKGDTFQNTYTGKNLCGIPDQTITKNGVTITIKDGEITLNGTANSSGTQNLSPINTTTLSGNHTINVIYTGGSITGSTTGNFNLRYENDGTLISNSQVSFNSSSSNSKTINLSTTLIFGIYVYSGTKYNNYKFRPQLVAGTSSDYDYEPYVGGTSSPNPNYPQPIENVTGLQNIEICGKNLLNADSIIPAMISSQSYSSDTLVYDNVTKTLTMTNPNTDTYLPAIYNNANNIPSVNINVKKNTTYTLHFDIDQPSSTWKNCVMGLDKSVNKYKYITNLGEVNTITFNTGNYDTITFRIGSKGSVGTVTKFSNFQLEESSTVSEYEPYTGTTYEVNLGKNLISSITKQGNTLKFNGAVANEDYIFKAGTYTFSYTRNISNTISTFIKDTTGTQTALGTGTNITFTSNYDFNIWLYRSGITTEEASDIQLEVGSQSTTYSEYFTPIELNSIPETEYEDSIKKSTGKNLFDKNNINEIRGTINVDSGIFTYSSTSMNYCFYMPCKSNTTYTIQKRNDGDTNRFKFASCSTEISTQESAVTNLTSKTSDDSASSLTITTGPNDIYIMAQYYRSAETKLTKQQILDSIMINEGSTALPYEPYGKVWYIEKNIGKVVLDGSEGWRFTSGVRERFTTSLNDIALQPFNSSASIVAISNYFLGTTWYNLYNNTSLNNAFSSHNTVHQLNIRATQFNGSTSDFINWLNANKPEVLYALATPTYTEITNEDLINQLEAIQLLKGTNNISITSENLPVIFDYSFWNGDTEVDEDDRFLEVNQSNYLTSIELKDSCCVNNNILGTTYTKSAEVELLNLPVGTKLESQIITPEIGVKYNDDTTEYETFDDYVIESLNDEQTASNTKFTAMNGGTLLDKEYICSLSFENGQTHTINEFYQDACSQIGLTPLETAFDNSEIEITGNPFTNKETIRTVLSEVGKTSCSIIKFDWKNKTISLTWLSDQIDYEFNTSDYSILEGSLTQYGPLNTIIIANAQLNGENVVMTNQESVARDGEHQIVIDSPYFLYTETLRSQAIQAIYNKLNGLTYYDLKLTTPYGKPFLDIGNKIRINTNENQVYDTYVLSHTFKYDGTFNSVIESPALTSEEQTVKNEFKGNSIRERIKRTEVIVDKTTGDITALTERVISDENNTYTIEETNQLIQNASEGITNNFINSGGNNILRNTGLWFEDKTDVEYLYPSSSLYPDDDLFIKADPNFEYWKGDAERIKEEKAVNLSGILLKTGYLEQQQQVRNGMYTLSFKYRKLITLSTTKAYVNDELIELTEEEGEIIKTFNITTQNISFKLFSDTDGGCVIYDLMLNIGSEKAEYSQHQNETTTDTVNISKGITIKSSDTNTTFKANSDGIRVYNSKDMTSPVTDYTDTGMNTNRMKVKEEAEIVQVLWKNVGNNTWISRL